MAVNDSAFLAMGIDFLVSRTPNSTVTEIRIHEKGQFVFAGPRGISSRNHHFCSVEYKTDPVIIKGFAPTHVHEMPAREGKNYPDRKSRWISSKAVLNS